MREAQAMFSALMNAEFADKEVSLDKKNLIYFLVDLIRHHRVTLPSLYSCVYGHHMCNRTNYA